MADPGSKSSEPMRQAAELWTRWLRDGRGGDALALDRLCAERPELASELRALHAVTQMAQAAARSRSFEDALRDQFGDDAELTVKLEAAAPGAVAAGEGAQSAPPPAETPNAARYALEGEVARGGMGVIFRVRDRDLSRMLAMKVMPLTRSSSTGPQTAGAGRGEGLDATTRLGLARFLEEAQVTAQLDHPGIVPVHEVGFDAQGQPFFTMKLVKGRNLNEVFKLARVGEGWEQAGRAALCAPSPGASSSGTHGVARPAGVGGTEEAPQPPEGNSAASDPSEGWNLPRAVGVVVKASQALAYAHSKGVIHRDLKPANIMVGRFGEVFVMDWGLAKITGHKDLHDIRPNTQAASAALGSPRREAAATGTPESPLLTMDGSVVGTPAYMPPEQARGQVEAVDQASDIYALGAILYNLLTGQPPYVEPEARLSPHTILARVLDGPPRRVHLLNPRAPPELIAICEKAMAREPAARYASGLDLAEDLQAFLDHRVVRAYRTGAVAEFASWVRRNRTLASVVAVAAVLPAIGVAVFFRQQTLANERLRLHSYATDMRVASLALEEDNLGRVTELVRKYQPRRGETDLRGFEWRYLWQQCRGDERHTFAHRGLVRGARFSPDGTRIMTASLDGVVRIWDAKSQALTKRLAGSSDPTSVGAPSFSADGKWLAVATGNSIVIWDASTWAQVTALPVDAWRLAFSPDSRWLACWSRSRLSLIDTTSWAVQPLQTETPQDPAEAEALAFSADSERLFAATSGAHIEEWNIADRQKLREFRFPRPHGDQSASHVACIAVSETGLLAAGQREGRVRLWDLRTGEALVTTNAHLRTVWGMAFSSDGERLATASFDQTIKLWDVAAMRTLATLRGHRDEVWSVAFSPDDRWLISASKDRTAKLWNAEPRPATALIPGPDRFAHFSRDSRSLVSIESTKTNVVLDYWTVATGLHERRRLLAGEPPYEDIVRRVLAPPVPSLDLRHLACLLDDGSLGVLDMERMHWTPTTFSGQYGLTNSEGALSFTLDGRLLGANAGTGWRFWDVAEKRERPLPDEHWGSVLPTVSPDGRLLAGPSTNFTIKLWDLATQKELARLDGHAWRLGEPRFSPDGKLVATFGWESFVRLWRVPSGVAAAPPFLGHKEGAFLSSFAPDSRTLATSTTEFTTRLWHVATGQELMSFDATGGPVFAPDGNTLALWTRQGIRLLRAPSLAEIGRIEDAEDR
jgi:WD40 repeat protein/serine/threonine protein kinase